MADDTIQLPPDSTGPFLDTESLTVGANTVHRERHQIAGDSATDIAPVTAADGLLVNLGTNNDVSVTGSVAVTNAGLTALAGAIAGTEVQVDIVSGGSAGAQYTEDDAAIANPIGTALAMVRDDALSGQTTADGDIVVARSTDKGELYVKHVDAIPITDNSGSLTVDGTVAVTGVSTLAEQQTQTAHLAAIETAVELLDDAIAGSEMQVDVVSSALPTGASTLAEQQTQTTHLATIAGDTTAIETAIQIIDDWDETNRAAVNTIAGQVGVQGASGTVNALTQRVVLATDVGLPAGSSNIGDVDVLSMPVTEVVGDVAADAAVPANPLAIGGRASTAAPTAVSADGDSVYAWLNRLGMSVVSAIPGLGLNADPHTLLSETAQYTTTQTSTVLVTGGASERIIVTSIQIQAGATTAATVQVYFGTGAYARGTDEAIFDGEFAPSATLKPGFVSSPPSGYRAGALGDDVLVTTSAGITLTVTVWYYVLGV